MDNYNDAIFKGIFETALDAIITIDKEGVVQAFNPAAVKLFGYTPKELIGLNVAALMPEPYAKEHDSGRTVKAKRKDGAIFPIFLSVSEFTVENETFFAGIIREISKQKKTEAFLAEQHNKLKQLNDELESFSYSVSHDLNAPLRHIIGYIELLNKHVENSEDKQVKKYMKIITDEAFRMEGLIQSLLSFSRLGRASLKKSKLVFNDLINEVIARAQPETKGRAIDWQIASLPEVYCDKKMFFMVWENLISNALKFTKNKKKTMIKINSTKLESEYQFSIQDNGVGFDPRYSDKLFKVFQRLHSNSDFSGTGIGLVNVKKIIEKHGGRIWIEGKIEEGVTVYFTVPFE